MKTFNLRLLSCFFFINLIKNKFSLILKYSKYFISNKFYLILVILKEIMKIILKLLIFRYFCDFLIELTQNPNVFWYFNNIKLNKYSIKNNFDTKIETVSNNVQIKNKNNIKP